MRCERICSLSRFVVALDATTAGTAATQWFERTLDDSANKRLSVAQAFLAADAILDIWRNVASGMVVYEKMIARNVEQAHYFGRLVEDAADLELVAPIGLDIVCFRFNPGGLADEALDAVNKEILMQLHESGIAVPSYSTLNGRYCLRIAIANHRSTLQDFDLLAHEVRRIGTGLASDRPARPQNT